MGRALLVASDKGGVGKSTTATNLASYLVNNSRTVIILKTDKNNDILSWNEKRKQNVSYS
ncbi:nucleotide-binding protein [Escherichia coli]|uniref:nucleotide-binding protein n=1 Tax=Escherichia coli TaxID=562 RepID=UPI0006A4DDCA|nr:putative crown gall tumor protein VirC1 [Escherichia coli]